MSSQFDMQMTVNSYNLVKKFFVFIFGLDLLQLFLIVHKLEGPLVPNLQLAAHGLYIIYHTGL